MKILTLETQMYNDLNRAIATCQDTANALRVYKNCRIRAIEMCYPHNELDLAIKIDTELLKVQTKFKDTLENLSRMLS
jgi:hypothetical protein